MDSRLSRLLGWLGVGPLRSTTARIGELNEALIDDSKRPGNPHFWPGAVRTRLTLNPDISRLLGKLEELRVLDVECDVHGAGHHRYECQPMSSTAIAAIEKAIGTEVPAECRKWMAEVGAGAGPGYGFAFQPLDYSAPKQEGPLPDRTVEDVTHLTDDVLANFSLSFTEPSGGGGDYLFGVRSYRGLLMLCQHGCGHDSILIVAGPQRGRVIDDTAAMGVTLDGAVGSFLPGIWTPEGHPLPTFNEWLERSIEREILKLPARRAVRLARTQRNLKKSSS